MADDEPFPESIENAWGSDHVNIEKGGDYIIEDEKRLPFIYRKVLGNGLSAVVEKVQHTITKEVFAKKVIKLPRLKSKGRESAEEHYQNEVAIIRGLSQHSHIIELFATYMTPRSGVLLLRPAAEEGDLQQYLDRYTDAVDRVTTEPVDLESMASVLERAFGCLSNGLAYMHSKGIRHKDIKPGNILIHQGIPIYTDFGASKDTKKDGQCTTEGRPESLTRRFCAPEVLEYDKRNFAADVYSLGCVFVEMLVRLSHLTEHDDLEEEGYAGIMESLHAILPSAKISPKVACLLDLILLMTLREPSRRPDSETLATNICCHEGLSCLQCHSVRLDSRPQPQSRSQSGPQWSPQFQSIGSYSTPQQAGSATVISRLGSVVRATYNAEHLQIVEQQLDPDFKVRSAGFFTEGRMFSVLFIEPAGANTVNNVTYYNGNLSQVQYGEYARSQVRRFIVVKQRREYCFAVPVFTYGNRGTRKPGVVADEHAIAHSHGSSPMLVADEAPLTKSPIPIVMNVSEESLSLASRIYFGIHHPIQFNVKVKDIGRVHPDWLPTFLGYWKMENGKDSQQSPDLTRDPANHETS
ncbi:unnamed protein product [Alternaria alternata]